MIKLKLGGNGSQRASTNGMLSKGSLASLLRYGRQQAQAAIQTPAELNSAASLDPGSQHHMQGSSIGATPPAICWYVIPTA